jgi:hypothetical protein
MAGVVMVPVAASIERETEQYGSEASRAVWAKDAAVLTQIYQDQINIAIWQRQLESELVDAVTDLLAHIPHERHWKAVLGPGSTVAWLNQHLPQFCGKTLLLQDIAVLVDMFSCLFDLREVGLRLAALDSAMCPRFHTDRTLCRLVTTYGGPGTEWLAHNQVDRTRLGSGNAGLQDAESGVFRRVEDIQQLSAGEVGLLKGEVWAGNGGAGLVHRSPTIMQAQKRLLLTLDIA